jgi:hypothetical protein
LPYRSVSGHATGTGTAARRFDLLSTIAKQEIKDLVLAEAAKGNVVFMTIEGPMAMPLEEFVQQPIEGILYDLNRLPEIVITFLDDPKWVNDYALALVITKLKADLKMAEAARGTPRAPGAGTDHGGL